MKPRNQQNHKEKQHEKDMDQKILSDGTIGSRHGTRSGAAEIAELRKEDYGGSYTIEGGRNDGERT